MKPNIHPKLNPVVFVDSQSGTEFVTTSTLTSEETKKINGVDHFVFRVDISSASHPFYTGKQVLVDTAGRVDKFRARMEASKQAKEKVDARKAKKITKENVEEKITRKAVEKEAMKEAEKAEKEAKKKEVAKKTAKKTVVKKEAKAAKKPAAKKTASKKK